MAGRPAFTAHNPSWPNRNTVVLNLGTALAGQTIHLRFRIGTDAGAGDIGWELDNLSVQGITIVGTGLIWATWAEVPLSA